MKKILQSICVAIMGLAFLSSCAVDCVKCKQQCSRSKYSKEEAAAPSESKAEEVKSEKNDKKSKKKKTKKAAGGMGLIPAVKKN